VVVEDLLGRWICAYVALWFMTARLVFGCFLGFCSADSYALCARGGDAYVFGLVYCEFDIPYFLVASSWFFAFVQGVVVRQSDDHREGGCLVLNTFARELLGWQDLSVFWLGILLLVPYFVPRLHRCWFRFSPDRPAVLMSDLSPCMSVVYCIFSVQMTQEPACC
jgi:hypothetical protein